MTEHLTPEELRLAQALAMNEKGSGGLQEAVNRKAKEVAVYLRPLKNYHTHNSRHSEAGFPDNIIVIRQWKQWGSRHLVIENKKQKEKPSADQIIWLNDYSTIQSTEVFLFRPLDLLNGTIERVLWSPRPVECGASWCREYECRLDEVEE